MSGFKKILISLFIMFNFLVMIRFHLPLDKKFFSTVYRPIDSYLSFFSLYQSWTMFSPNPSRTNAYITAEVLFEDKSKDTYVFPKSSDMSIIEKYIRGERLRVIGEAIRNNENSFLWEDAAKFALRKLRNTNFNKIPLKVKLIRHWDTIPDMRKEFRPHLSKIQKYQSHHFYTYEVL